MAGGRDEAENKVEDLHFCMCVLVCVSVCFVYASVYIRAAALVSGVKGGRIKNNYKVMIVDALGHGNTI